jgi:hypothetical protein
MDDVTETAAPHDRSRYEQFWFELGYGACWADAYVMAQNGVSFALSDAVFERAWAILPDGYDGDASDLVPLDLPAIKAAARREAFKEAAMIALVQRCERGTPWDLACVTIAAAIRELAATNERTTDD